MEEFRKIYLLMYPLVWTILFIIEQGKISWFPQIVGTQDLQFKKNTIFWIPGIRETWEIFRNLEKTRELKKTQENLNIWEIEIEIENFNKIYTLG